MERIAITNQKGGVGKTTISAHVAAGLARRNNSVLAVDLDPQGYLTRHFGLRDKLYSADIDNLARHLVGDPDGPLSDLIVETDEDVDLIPSNFDMRGVGDALSNARNREMRLSNLLGDLDSHDYLLIDAPPNLGILSDNAILATQQLLIPMQAEDSSLDALDMLLDEITEIEQAFGVGVGIVGIIPNLVPRDGVATSTLETVRSTDGMADLVYPYEIRKRADIKYAMRNGETLFQLNPDSDMIPVFEQLAGDIENAVN